MILFEDEKKEHHLYSVGISGGQRKAPFESEIQKIILNGATYCYKHSQEVPIGASKRTSNKCENPSCKSGTGLTTASGWCPDSGYHCSKCAESDRASGQCPQCLLIKNMKHFKIINENNEINPRIQGSERNALEKLMNNGAVFCYRHDKKCPVGHNKTTTMVCELKDGNGNKICKNYWCGDGSHYCESCNSDRSKGNCVQCNVRNNMKHFGVNQVDVPPEDSHCLGVSENDSKDP
jgi:hypothetical protein